MELNSYQPQEVHLQQHTSNILSISGNANYLFLKMSMWMFTRFRAGKLFFDSRDHQEIFLFSRLS